MLLLILEREGLAGGSAFECGSAESKVVGWERCRIEGLDHGKSCRQTGFSPG